MSRSPEAPTCTPPQWIQRRSDSVASGKAKISRDGTPTLDSKAAFRRGNFFVRHRGASTPAECALQQGQRRERKRSDEDLSNFDAQVETEERRQELVRSETDVAERSRETQTVEQAEAETERDPWPQSRVE